MSESRYKTVSPTGSYKITLPAGVAEDDDERVSSFWLTESDVLLQISSYRRTAGEATRAGERAKARAAREKLSDIEAVALEIPSCNDVAAFRGVDSDGVMWYYIYAVWDDLTILATISGPKDKIAVEASWAFDAVRSLSRPTP